MEVRVRCIPRWLRAALLTLGLPVVGAGCRSASARSGATGPVSSVFEALAAAEADSTIPLIVGATSHQPNSRTTYPLLTRLADLLEAANPGREAELALGRGDRRLLAVEGYALYAPGAVGPTELLRQQGRLRILAHTSDSVIGDEHARYNRVAATFAKAYNCELLRRLGEPSDCR